MKFWLKILFSCIAILVFFVLVPIAIIVVPKIQWKEWDFPKGTMPVSLETYNRDKEQIGACYRNNLKYYRTHRNEDGTQSYYSYIPSPNNTKETDGEFEVFVDTIVYDTDGLKCVIFLAFNHASNPKSFEGRAMIGFRNNISDSLELYPLKMFSSGNYETPHSAVRVIGELFYNELKGNSLKGSPYQNITFPDNVGDPLFFKRSPLFTFFDRAYYEKRYKICFEDSVYNCQVDCQSDSFFKYKFKYYK